MCPGDKDVSAFAKEAYSQRVKYGTAKWEI